jgi:transposase-like protein
MVRENVEAGSSVYTDALKSYEGLDEFKHQVVDHAETLSTDRFIPIAARASGRS